MLLIYTQKPSSRITYSVKHICTRILGIEVQITSVIEELISYTGPKLSYGKQPLGNEFFIQSHELLTQQGFEAIEIVVKDWNDTKCFFAVSDKSALPFDIFAASFYLLSRYEEYLPHVKDEYGRFPASESLAYKEGFIRQPVIDMWAGYFKAALQQVFPKLVFPKKEMSIHNLVVATQPFAFKQKGLFRSVVGYGYDILKGRFKQLGTRTRVLLGLQSDPNDTFAWMVDVVKQSKTPLTVFFLLGETTQFENSLNTHRQKFKMLVKFVSDYKEVGLICSKSALTAYETLKLEKRRMETITNRTLDSAINAELLVDLPDIYRDLVELEIKRDHTMVYEDTAGFRAGTCTPFLFYDLDYEIKTPLIIHPIAMTTQGLKKDDAIEGVVDEMMQTVEAVKGTFSILFSNTDFSNATTQQEWRTIFSEKLQQYA
ncbi:MAG: hypothetical protein MK211_10660 [Flavobacteriales bacterium]|jgi:hypothetical protein|uniref:DUF7033 domain-containing protein n=1 Tax=Candidatus Ulvibacter alkanivorans TaxID=2267620 RepID=UPI000DF1C852|nr:hypothetical protein [Candidatus Ulvibacter alkanivorans]MCH2490597.1 hypothetical protein [Flavobacteriales bacterium]